MSENQGWLKVVIDQMQDDLTEMKADVKVLLETKAKNEGKVYVLAGLITIGINLLAAWLKLT